MHAAVATMMSIAVRAAGISTVAPTTHCRHRENAHRVTRLAVLLPLLTCTVGSDADPVDGPRTWWSWDTQQVRGNPREAYRGT